MSLNWTDADHQRVKVLSDFVKTYCDFGNHRTGCETQAETESWLSELLDQKSDELVKFSYTYQHFQVNSTVSIEDRVIPSLPLYYESTDTISGGANILTESVSITEDENQANRQIQEISSQARESDYDAVIVATCSKANSLYALNVTPVLKNNIPIVLVSGEVSQIPGYGNAKLEYSASFRERSAQNIIARFGTRFSGSPVVITTPMSGWFSCAGERGTGLALAIDLADQLGKSIPVELIITSGHELNYWGGYQWANSLDSSPGAVIHIGSCVGAINATLNTWVNFSREKLSQFDLLAKKLDISTTFVSHPLEHDSWVGEAQCWAQFGCPMISIAGSNPLFHTVNDQWQVAVTENSLLEILPVLQEVGRLIKNIFSN